PPRMSTKMMVLQLIPGYLCDHPAGRGFGGLSIFRLACFSTYPPMRTAHPASYIHFVASLRRRPVLRKFLATLAVCALATPCLYAQSNLVARLQRRASIAQAKQ